MTLHRSMSWRVHVWCPMPYFAGLQTWSCRLVLYTLEHPAWYTRLALGSNIHPRVGPLTLIVAGDSGIQAVQLLTCWTPAHFRVTGGVAGIGRATALTFAREGGQIDHC